MIGRTVRGLKSEGVNKEVGRTIKQINKQTKLIHTNKQNRQSNKTNNQNKQVNKTTKKYKPVLSTAMVSITPIFSITDEPLINTPFFAAVAIAHTEGIGVATTIAHGHAKTNNTNPFSPYTCQSPVTPPPITTNNTVHTITLGVQYNENVSTNRE